MASSTCSGPSELRPAAHELTCSPPYSLVNAGDMPDKNPQRYYKYLLLDPLDAPFATFRYYYRSWGKLANLIHSFTS